MSARSHPRPDPATTGGLDIRLPWWALALPALAFVALFLLLLNPSNAHAATGDPAVAQLLRRLQELLVR